LILLALFYTVIDVIKFRTWAFFFVVIGVNAITIYVAQAIIPFDVIARNVFGGLARVSGTYQPLVLPIGEVLIEWLLLFYLYRNRIFLRV
jgi:predicted acyltransferase